MPARVWAIFLSFLIEKTSLLLTPATAARNSADVSPQAVAH
jgi:hypothetical protein